MSPYAVVAGRRRPVDEVAVEVDVVLVHTADPGEADRVESVHEDDPHAVGPGAGSFVEPPALEGRAGVALDAVRAGDDHEYRVGVVGAEL